MAFRGGDAMKLFHGGALNEASQRYNIPLGDWIDLSTGISPYSWPVPELPQQVWRNLPDAVDSLTAVASQYYGCDKDHILPVPGSQFAIETLPIIFSKGQVAVPKWGYTEHAYGWQKAGHQLIWYKDFEQLLQLVKTRKLTAAVIINPNNPSAELIAPAELLMLKELLVANGGTLIVDEAFMDCTPQHSLFLQISERADYDGLIILRSVGKFFGLAGLRLGFLVANKQFLARVDPQLPPWAVSHPARWVGRQALADKHWQKQQLLRLQADAKRWLIVLERYFPQLQWRANTLFFTGFGSLNLCAAIDQLFARQGILLRLIAPADALLQGSESEQAAIRFGLPTNEQQPVLMKDLATISQTCTELHSQ